MLDQPSNAQPPKGKAWMGARVFDAWENLIKNDIEVQKWVGGNGVAIASPTGRAYPIDEGGYLPNSMGNLMGKKGM